MFTADTRSENGFDIIVLTDVYSGISASIIPACGGILHAFTVQHNGEDFNLVEQYSSKKEFDDSVEAKGFKSCKLSPFVCRLKEGKYKFGEKEYTIEKFYLGKHALHGLIYDATFEIVQATAGPKSAKVELLFAYKGTDKGFPFKYDCRLIYELKKNATLSITTIIKNHESTAIPVTDGWHPYFSFGGSVNDLSLCFKVKAMLEMDEDLIPTGKKIPYHEFETARPIGSIKMDNGFLLDFGNDEPVVVLADVKRKLQLEIWPSKSYPVLQLYIPDHRQSIAIENLGAAPDAFNNEIGLTILPAGGEAVFNTAYRIGAMD